MATWAGFSEEELRKLKQQSARGNNQGKQSGFPRKEHGRNPQRRMPASETVISSTALDPSMSLKIATQNNATTSNPTSSHRKPKEKPQEKSGSPEKTHVVQDSEDPVDLSSVAVKQEVPDDLETDDTKVLSHEIKSLEKFREQQKAIEEANKQKKALLSKTLTERRKKARQEAFKLEHIQKELAKLDSLLTADVQVIRDRIEESSRDFLEAQKRFQKAEAEYVDSKIDLHEKSEQKEQLTEHLYTIIHQNEVRKAKKLAQLMKELEMESSEEELQLPELPLLSSFSPLQHGPLSPGKAHMSPVIENGPSAHTETEKTGENVSGDTKSDETGAVKVKETSSDNVSVEKVTENNAEPNSKTADQKSDSDNTSSHSKEGETEKKDEKETQNTQSEQTIVEKENPDHQSCETKSPNPEKVLTSGGDACSESLKTVNAHSITDNPETVKVGQVSQYVRDRLETVQNLIKETESTEAGVIELDTEKERIPSSWDFSGDVSSIGETKKS